jgi:hypothetical protein
MLHGAGILTYIWVIFGANVDKYSIHGAYGTIYRTMTKIADRLSHWPLKFEPKNGCFTSLFVLKTRFSMRLLYWLVVSTPLKNMKLSWDDEIPNIWKKQKNMFQTTNQYIFWHFHMTHGQFQL